MEAQQIEAIKELRNEIKNNKQYLIAHMGILHHKSRPAVLTKNTIRTYDMGRLFSHDGHGETRKIAALVNNYIIYNKSDNNSPLVMEIINGTRRAYCYYYFHNGLLHRDGLPAVICDGQYEYYYFAGKIHNYNAAAYTKYSRKNQINKIISYKYYYHGKLHSYNDKEAILYQNGRRAWYNYGIICREPDKGPAIIDKNGKITFYSNGRKLKDSEARPYVDLYKQRTKAELKEESKDCEDKLPKIKRSAATQKETSQKETSQKETSQKETSQNKIEPKGEKRKIYNTRGRNKKIPKKE